MILYIKVIEVERDVCSYWAGNTYATVMAIAIHTGISRRHDGAMGLVVIPVAICRRKDHQTELKSYPSEKCKINVLNMAQENERQNANFDRLPAL